MTIVIVAAILMGAFGPTDGFWAKVFTPIFTWFGPSTAGTIYSFGFTLLSGVLLNFVFGVWATRFMLRGASRIKGLRNPWLYGGEKKEQGTAEEPRNIQENIKIPHINFVGNRKKFYTFSCSLIGFVLIFAAIFGVSMDVEFKGGAMLVLDYQGEIDLNAVESTIETSVNTKNLTFQTGSDLSNNKTLTVTMPGTQTISTDALDELISTLNTQFPNNTFTQNSVSNVNASMAKNSSSRVSLPYLRQAA